MPVGSISSSRDTVGVAVVNYQVPVLESKEEVIKNCHRIAEFVDGVKLGYPGLDLIIFPEYSTQGFHPTKWEELCTTVPGPETAIFAEACRRNKVWGVFSITGELNPIGNPFNSFVLINDQGEIVLNYHKINPWVPKEPWYPGDETMVVEGPKGLKIGANICYDSNLPEIVRDTVMKGAELVVRIQGYMYPSKEQQIKLASIRAWENLAYFAVANMAGRDKVYSYFGHSNIVNFDGTTLAECGTTPDEVTYAELSISAIRNARKNWTAENHLYNLTHRGYSAVKNGVANNPYSFYETWVNDAEKARKICESLTRSTPEQPEEKPVEVEEILLKN
ncbi:aliphatic amidase [Aneurinibacillus sp. Ricciae_BoGa-3]|uniref:aliphatic amidase n=1 Tax=Aneurinibacillus sp. Ricciae_BoGa-3 TaxID=3022697 RepID=UPI002341CC62|nr:aliphatic amidase [Aneurinibacillus sp. Ricciae_BoGa-3]WCK55241.1 aliphatic amidase [Aneurinibacillus sp. Ricciae_BoGa-3]